MNAKESLLKCLSDRRRKETEDLIVLFNLSEQSQLELIKNEVDLMLFSEESLAGKLDVEKLLSLDKGARRNAFMKEMRCVMKDLEKGPIDYSAFPSLKPQKGKIEICFEESTLGFGRCPCPIDGEETRCCKLRTLDVITQCAFSCAYCSVQAFYDKNRIRVVSDLKKKLDALKLDDSIWHIGTGQASDSLFLGDDYSTLSDLAYFAEKHPGIVIELKSKACRSDIFKRKYPRNMIFTWSLNAETIIEKEERGTAALSKRLECAQMARDNGSLVGFHIHPMVYFKGWEEEYAHVVEEIKKRFSPSEILMISSGTLIFTKENLRFIREKMVRTRVPQMEKTLSAGKYTYPFEIKKEMFTHLFSTFDPSFIENIFTYLCLEDPRLWLPVLKRQYSCDKDFEMDMKKHYLMKINSV